MAPHSPGLEITYPLSKNRNTCIINRWIALPPVNELLLPRLEDPIPPFTNRVLYVAEPRISRSTTPYIPFGIALYPVQERDKGRSEPISTRLVNEVKGVSNLTTPRCRRPAAWC